MHRKFTSGWFDFQGTRGRLNWLGTSMLVFIVFAIAAVPLFILSLGVAIIPIAVLYMWITISLLTQRIRHCGAEGVVLLLLTVLCVIFPIAQLVLLFYPGADTVLVTSAKQPMASTERVEPKLFSK